MSGAGGRSSGFIDVVLDTRSGHAGKKDKSVSVTDVVDMRLEMSL